MKNQTKKQVFSHVCSICPEWIALPLGHEDMTATRSIIELVRDRPELSQDKIAKTLNVSKGKVNKVLNKFKAGDYAKEFDFNIIINGEEYSPDGNNNTNNNTNYNINN